MLRRAAFIRRHGDWQLVGMGWTGEWLDEGTSMDQSGKFCEMSGVGDKKTGREHKTKHKYSTKTWDITHTHI